MIDFISFFLFFVLFWGSDGLGMLRFGGNDAGVLFIVYIEISTAMASTVT